MKYYFDMDGVLAVYEPENPPGSRPWLDPSARFYATRHPDESAITLASIAARHADVTVVTRVPDEPKRLHAWVDEKLSWLDAHVPALSGRRIIVISSDKHDKSAALRDVPLDERREHCLVDDDPAILTRWVDAGGSAVQYSRTSTPHEPWNGPLVHGEMPAGYAWRALRAAFGATREEVSAACAGAT